MQRYSVRAVPVAPKKKQKKKTLVVQTGNMKSHVKFLEKQSKTNPRKRIAFVKDLPKRHI